MEKAVIYIRLSTKKESVDARLGSEAQKKACKDYCIRNNIYILSVFEEIVSACVPFHKRPVFPEAIACCSRNRASLVVAVQDRLTRNLDDWTGFNSGRIYGKLTPKLICAENPTYSTLEGDIRALFSQHERDQISKRTKNALAVKKELGYSLGSVGRSESVRRAREATSDALTLAVELRSQGHPYELIADELNAVGFVTSRGTPWSSASIAYRLRSLATSD